MADEVDIAEIDLLAALLGLGDGRDSGVGLAELQRAQEAVKGEIVELDLDAHLLADGLHQGDVEAVQLEVFVVKLEGRVIGGDSNRHPARRLDLLPGIGDCGWRSSRRGSRRPWRVGGGRRRLRLAAAGGQNQAQQGKGQQTEQDRTFRHNAPLKMGFLAGRPAWIDSTQAPTGRSSSPAGWRYARPRP